MFRNTKDLKFFMGGAHVFSSAAHPTDAFSSEMWLQKTKLSNRMQFLAKRYCYKEIMNQTHISFLFQLSLYIVLHNTFTLGPNSLISVHCNHNYPVDERVQGSSTRTVRCVCCTCARGSVRRPPEYTVYSTRKKEVVHLLPGLPVPSYTYSNRS